MRYIWKFCQGAREAGRAAEEIWQKWSIGNQKEVGEKIDPWKAYLREEEKESEEQWVEGGEKCHVTECSMPWLCSTKKGDLRPVTYSAAVYLFSIICALFLQPETLRTGLQRHLPYSPPELPNFHSIALARSLESLESSVWIISLTHFNEEKISSRNKNISNEPVFWKIKLFQ